MLNTLIQEIILLVNGNRRESAIAAFSIFGIIAVFFFGSLVVAHFLYLCFLRGRRITFLTSTIQTIGALFFFYGNNINILVDNYGADLGCSTVCAVNSGIISSFALGIALIIFYVVPLVVKSLLKLLEFKRKLTSESIVTVVNKVPDWFAAIDMITIFVKINTVYSAVVVMVQTTEYCNSTDIATSTTFLLFCIFIGIFSEVVYFLTAMTTNKDNNKLYSILVTFGFISMMICLPLYLLADNRQPLDCAFGCDTFTFNTTANAATCNSVANEGVRLGFITVSLIFIATIPVVYFILNQNARDELTQIHSEIKQKITEEFNISKVGVAIKDTVTNLGRAAKDKLDDLGETIEEAIDDVKYY